MGGRTTIRTQAACHTRASLASLSIWVPTQPPWETRPLPATSRVSECVSGGVRLDRHADDGVINQYNPVYGHISVDVRLGYPERSGVPSAVGENPPEGWLMASLGTRLAARRGSPPGTQQRSCAMPNCAPNRAGRRWIGARPGCNRVLPASVTLRHSNSRARETRRKRNPFRRLRAGRGH